MFLNVLEEQQICADTHVLLESSIDLLTDATFYTSHRRPGYRYFDPSEESKQHIQHGEICEDTIYLFTASSRSGYLDNATAAAMDQRHYNASKRLRKVIKSTVPVPRCASVSTKAHGQRSKVKQMTARTDGCAKKKKRIPWQAVQAKGKPNHF
jgi:hypothetical protein